MSNTKHTPGPWELSTISDSRRIYDRHGTHICDASIGKVGVPYVQIKEEETCNAKLIAAAPDLLGAVQAMLIHFWDGYTDPMEAARKFAKQSPSSATAKALAAIEKAIGK